MAIIGVIGGLLGAFSIALDLPNYIYIFCITYPVAAIGSMLKLPFHVF